MERINQELNEPTKPSLPNRGALGKMLIILAAEQTLNTVKRSAHNDWYMIMNVGGRWRRKTLYV